MALFLSQNQQQRFLLATLRIDLGLCSIFWKILPSLWAAHCSLDLAAGEKKPQHTTKQTKQLYISPIYSYPFICAFLEAGTSEVVPMTIYLFQ